MTNFLRTKVIVLPILLLFLSVIGCSHSYYAAEVDGPGARADLKTHVGVVYLIPPESSQLKMKILSLGISTSDQREPELRMRLYFVRRNVSLSDPGAKRNNIVEFVDPREQAVILSSGGTKIYPNRTFGNPEKKPLVELMPNQKQVIDLLFPLPPTVKSSDELETFTFSWKVHYTKNKIQEGITRFDRKDVSPQNNAEFMTDPDYPDFPIHEYMVYPANYEWVPYNSLWRW